MLAEDCVRFDPRELARVLSVRNLSRIPGQRDPPES